MLLLVTVFLHCSIVLPLVPRVYTMNVVAQDSSFIFMMVKQQCAALVWQVNLRDSPLLHSM